MNVSCYLTWGVIELLPALSISVCRYKGEADYMVALSWINLVFEISWHKKG